MSGGDLVGVPAPGDVIAEKYRLDRVVGKGAAGIVFEATHELIGRRVALKWLYPHLAFNENVVRRFLREARAANVVDHPGVVEIYDAGHEGDSFYLVMELLRGEPLSAYIARGVESPEDLVQVLMPALRGIAAAHDHGIVHRDLKPDNIFLSSPRRGRAGGAKVLDFGISKLREKDKSAPLTSAGTYLGSPYYMAPEQIADSSTVDARADVYSLGVILYEGLTGAVPYDAESLSGLFIKITNEKPTPIDALRPDVPADLAAVVMKAMAARPEDRYPSVKKLAEALEPFAGGAVFATLDEALGDALGDAIATRRARPAAVEDDAEDALDEEPSELEQAPTKVSRELADELRDTNPPELSDDEVENPGRSTEVSIRPGESVDARDTDPPDRDTDPTKTPGGATPRAVAPPPPASRAMAALHGEPGLADLEASPTKPLIRADEVEGAPGAASTGRPASINIATAKTMEMSKPHWDETSMVGRSFAPEAPAKKLPWGAIIGASVLVAVLTVTIFIVALR